MPAPPQRLPARPVTRTHAARYRARRGDAPHSCRRAPTRVPAGRDTRRLPPPSRRDSRRDSPGVPEMCPVVHRRPAAVPAKAGDKPRPSLPSPAAGRTPRPPARPPRKALPGRHSFRGQYERLLAPAPAVVNHDPAVPPRRRHPLPPPPRRAAAPPRRRSPHGRAGPAPPGRRRHRPTQHGRSPRPQAGNRQLRLCVGRRRGERALPAARIAATPAPRNTSERGVCSRAGRKRRGLRRGARPGRDRLLPGRGVSAAAAASARSGRRVFFDGAPR